MTCKQKTNAKEDLEPAVSKLLSVEPSDGNFAESEVGFRMDDSDFFFSLLVNELQE